MPGSESESSSNKVLANLHKKIKSMSSNKRKNQEESDDFASGSNNERCVECLEKYAETLKTVNWLSYHECGKCYHETCSMYGTKCNNCGPTNIRLKK